MIVAYGSRFELQKGYHRDILAWSALVMMCEGQLPELVTIGSYERSREAIKMERV